MTQAPGSASGGGEPDRRRRLVILAICCMSLLIVGLDNTIVNVALPSIGRDLHAKVSGLQWIVAAYTLVLASLLMLSGSMADRIGRRRVFAVGLCLFTAGSLLCSLASSLAGLVVFRMIQALGGSMLNPVAMSIIRNVFTDSRERAQAIGFWGATVGISLALGPVVGGALVQSVGWPAIFLINIPVGLTALFLTLRFVPESKADRPRRVDPIGQILVIVLLGALTYAIIDGPTAGWLSTQEVALFVGAAACLAGLLAYEARRDQPLLEVAFFRSTPFSGAVVIAIAAFAALGGFLFLNTLYLQEVREFSALKAGLYTLPIAAMTLVFAPLSGRLVGNRGPRPALLVGGAGIGLGALILTELTPTTSTATLLVAYAIFGVGFGMVNPPITNTAVAGMPPAQAGVASAIASTSRQLGQTLGVAIVGALAASSLNASHAGRPAALPSDVGWWLITACGVLVVAIGLLSTTGRANASAAAVATATA
ncbi:MAG TPA: MFS transporter [Solirubrobacteraceae bacterium]